MPLYLVALTLATHGALHVRPVASVPLSFLNVIANTINKIANTIAPSTFKIVRVSDKCSRASRFMFTAPHHLMCQAQQLHRDTTEPVRSRIQA